MDIADFQRRILDWGRHHRRDMPWRKTRDPYKILVSEVMLQQTQVSRVLPKYETFLREFPTPEALASSSQATLLRMWQGLGYWNRALRLRDAARMVVNEFDGKFPERPRYAGDTAWRRAIHRRRGCLLRVWVCRAVSRYQHPARIPVLFLPRRGRRSRQPHHGDCSPIGLARRPSRVGLRPVRLRRDRAPRQDNQPSQQALLPAERLRGVVPVIPHTDPPPRPRPRRRHHPTDRA